MYLIRSRHCEGKARGNLLKVSREGFDKHYSDKLGFLCFELFFVIA